MALSITQVFARALVGVLVGLALIGAGLVALLASGADWLTLPWFAFLRANWLGTSLMGAGMVCIVVIVLVARQITLRGVQKDLQTIGYILRDARHNDMRDTYPMRFEEFGRIFQYLRESARKMAAEKNKLKGLGYLDHLSHLANRRYFERRLRKLHRLMASQGASSLLIIDIDYFKQVNDTHGHDVGDSLVSEFAQVLRRAVRQTDFLARLGGDEFCVIYPHTPLTHGYSYAERLRKQLPRELKLAKGVVHPLSWTGGISVMDPSDRAFDEVLWRADQALIRAKQAGRNNTQLEAAGTHPPQVKSSA